MRVNKQSISRHATGRCRADRTSLFNNVSVSVAEHGDMFRQEHTAVTNSVDGSYYDDNRVFMVVRACRCCQPVEEVPMLVDAESCASARRKAGRWRLALARVANRRAGKIRG